VSDWDAATYDKVSDPQARWAIPVVERIEGTPERILDAGCGTGRVTELLIQRFPHASVVAVDASLAMVAQARTRLGGRAEVLHRDLTEPLRIDPVDVVFSNAVFHWIDDHPKLFANIANELKPGGQLVAQWGGFGNIENMLVVTRDFGPQPYERNFATPDETKHRLEAAGFDEVQTWLEPAPTQFESRDAFATYLRTVCLRSHLDLLRPDEQQAYVDRVVDAMPEHRIDYVRLNAVARRS
jgi:trans-aconitate 2-methyltransferase